MIQNYILSHNCMLYIAQVKIRCSKCHPISSSLANLNDQEDKTIEPVKRNKLRRCTTFHGTLQSCGSAFWVVLPLVSNDSSFVASLGHDSPSHRGSGMISVLRSLGIRLVAISVSLNFPNIVFLNTRQAMIFTNTTLGSQKTVRRMVGTD
jgi:hypothetical protein